MATRQSSRAVKRHLADKGLIDSQSKKQSSPKMNRAGMVHTHRPLAQNAAAKVQRTATRDGKRTVQLQRALAGLSAMSSEHWQVSCRLFRFLTGRLPAERVRRGQPVGNGGYHIYGRGRLPL